MLLISESVPGLSLFIRTAKERHPGVIGYAEAMMIAYNAKSKYRLSMRKLYGKSDETDQENNDVDDDTI